VRGLVQRAVSAPPTPFLLVAAEALWLTTAQWREGGSTTTTISAAHLAASCGPGGLGRAGLRGYRRRTRHSWVAFANTMEFGLVGWGKARRLCACGMAQVLRLLVRLHRWCVNMGRAHTSLCTVHTAPLCELLHRCTVSVSERRRVESVCVTPPQLSTAAWCRSTRATARLGSIHVAGRSPPVSPSRRMRGGRKYRLCAAPGRKNSVPRAGSGRTYSMVNAMRIRLQVRIGNLFRSYCSPSLQCMR